MAYFSFQGELWASPRDTDGNPTGFVWMGNVPEFQLSLEIEKIEHIESFTGQRATDATLVKSKKGSISLSVEELTEDNIKLALYGVSSAVAGGSVTDEELPSGLVAGSVAGLSHPGVSALVIEDSAGTPATLTAGTHYTLDADYGSVTFLNVTGFTQPFLASYTYAGGTAIALFGGLMPERWIRFKGINTVDNSKVMIDLYKVSFEPTSGFSLISDDFNKLPLKGNLLADSTKQADPTMGLFGRYMEL